MSTLRTFLKATKHILATTFRLSWLYAQCSYSQDGEDLFIAKFFAGQKKGFYVDVGAHHPYRYSNTYLLSQRGWSGINIDATPGSMAAFQRLRTRDKNLELAVSQKSGNFTYYMFEDPALNTLSKKQAQSVIRDNQSTLKKKVAVQSHALSEVLRQHVAKNQQIDFLNIDVEGVDEAIVRSNDWKAFRPQLLAIEILSSRSIEEIVHLPLCVFLKIHGYHLIARFSNTAFFSPLKG